MGSSSPDGQRDETGRDPETSQLLIAQHAAGLVVFDRAVMACSVTAKATGALLNNLRGGTDIGRHVAFCGEFNRGTGNPTHDERGRRHLYFDCHVLLQIVVEDSVPAESLTEPVDQHQKCCAGVLDAVGQC
jgi:hypothetical protein